MASDHFYSRRLPNHIERRATLAVVVSDDPARTLAIRSRLLKLLCRPDLVWATRHAEMNDRREQRCFAVDDPM